MRSTADLRWGRALSQHNITKNCGKDVNCADSITALGVDISNTPPWVEPEIAKLCRLLYALVRLVEQPTIAPDSFAGLMGLGQWFCQISRWMLSTFDCVYVFQRREPQIVPMQLGENALDEILLFVAFAPLLQADLERPFLPLIATCDASPAFGFGVSVHDCDVSIVETLAEHSEQNDCYLRTADTLDVEVPRVGAPVELPFSKESFTDVLSIRARHTSHSGAMGAHGLLLLIKWLLRSAGRLNSRTVVGIDAQVIMLAAVKGRTSAPTLAHIFRSIVAHCLAGGLMLYPIYVYIPTEFNPSDAPCRGKRRRPLTRRATQPARTSRLERQLLWERMAFERMRSRPFSFVPQQHD